MDDVPMADDEQVNLRSDLSCCHLIQVKAQVRRRGRAAGASSVHPNSEMIYLILEYLFDLGLPPSL